MAPIVLVTALTAAIIPPGQVATFCRATPAGVQHELLVAGGSVDDSTVNLEGEWGITVNTGNVDSDPALEFACRVAKYNGSTYITRLVMVDDNMDTLWTREIGDLGNVEVCGFTMADINGDGRDEALFPNVDVYFNVYPEYKGRVYALEGATGRDLLGWPYILPGWPEDPYLKPYSELVVADLDGDDTVEILCEVTDNNSVRKSGSALYCFGPKGDSLWKFWFYKDTVDRHGQWTGPAVADLDRDGRLEIICQEAKFNGRSPWNLIERRIFILNSDGTMRRNWQIEGLGTSFTPDYGSPVVADLNQDGGWEIIVLRRPGYLDVFDTAGTMLPGFPVNLTTDAGYVNPLFTRAFSTPCVADLDASGELEIVVGSFGMHSSAPGGDWAGRIHAFNRQGQALPGFPYVTRNGIWPSPGAANVDTLPGLEIMTAGVDSSFYVVSNAGQNLPGYPRRDFPTYFLPDSGNHGFIEGRIPMSKTPQLADPDADGLIEMLMAGADGVLYVWNTGGADDTAQMPLPTFHYDKGRTGWYRRTVTAVAEARPAPKHERGLLAGGNVVRGVLKLNSGIIRPEGNDAGQPPRITLHDASGRRVANLRPGPNDVRQLSPGVYFVTASGRDALRPRRCRFSGTLTRVVVVR